MRRRMQFKEQKRLNNEFYDDLDAVSPPAPSRSRKSREVHDEIPVLQNIARVYLGVIMEAVANGRRISWPKFITDSTPHRNFSNEEDIERYLKSKLKSNKR